MLNYIRWRLLATVVVLLGVSFLSFMILHLVPGDPVQTALGQAGASSRDIERLREQLGLNDPILVQYGRFLTRAVQGDLGRSILSQRPVAQLIREQLPATMQLTVAGMSIAIVLGVIFGVIAAVRANTLVDTSVMVVATLGVAVPGFWFALLLIYMFAVIWPVLPATGGEGLNRLILPAATLGISASAVIARLTRSSMLEVLRQDYVLTARGKGLPERAIIVRHALKNALIPVITVVGLQFGTLLSGAVIIETVFARPGIGRLAVDAILGKDYPVVQGTVLVAATSYVIANLTVDLLYAFVDPRVRYE